MLDAVIYTYQGKRYEMYFSKNLNARLPVKLKNNQASLLPWGRHQKQAGELFLGSFVHLSVIYSGNLARYHPVSVKLPIERFMMLDYEHRRHWFDVMKGQYIQGLVVRQGSEQRVYAVVIEPDNEIDYYPIWPRLVLGKKSL